VVLATAEQDIRVKQEDDALECFQKEYGTKKHLVGQVDPSRQRPTDWRRSLCLPQRL
jgi:hypothetical protein